MEKKFADLKKRPQPPVLSPEQQKVVLTQYKNLPLNDKKKFQQLFQHSCSYCEKEFNIPPIGWSHGICDRHKEQMYSVAGIDMPPSTEKNPCIDLKEFRPEEIKLAVDLFSIIYNKKAKH